MRVCCCEGLQVRPGAPGGVPKDAPQVVITCGRGGGTEASEPGPAVSAAVVAMAAMPWFRDYGMKCTAVLRRRMMDGPFCAESAMPFCGDGGGKRVRQRR